MSSHCMCTCIFAAFPQNKQKSSLPHFLPFRKKRPTTLRSLFKCLFLFFVFSSHVSALRKEGKKKIIMDKWESFVHHHPHRRTPNPKVAWRISLRGVTLRSRLPPFLTPFLAQIFFPFRLLRLSNRRTLVVNHPSLLLSLLIVFWLCSFYVPPLSATFYGN